MLTMLGTIVLRHQVQKVTTVLCVMSVCVSWSAAEQLYREDWSGIQDDERSTLNTHFKQLFGQLYRNYVTYRDSIKQPENERKTSQALDLLLGRGQNLSETIVHNNDIVLDSAGKLQLYRHVRRPSDNLKTNSPQKPHYVVKTWIVQKLKYLISKITERWQEDERNKKDSNSNPAIRGNESGQYHSSVESAIIVNSEPISEQNSFSSVLLTTVRRRLKRTVQDITNSKSPKFQISNHRRKRKIINTIKSGAGYSHVPENSTVVKNVTWEESTVSIDELEHIRKVLRKQRGSSSDAVWGMACTVFILVLLIWAVWFSGMCKNNREKYVYAEYSDGMQKMSIREVLKNRARYLPIFQSRRNRGKKYDRVSLLEKMSSDSEEEDKLFDQNWESISDRDKPAQLDT